MRSLLLPPSPCGPFCCPRHCLCLTSGSVLCSRWVVDTDPEWNVPEQQVLTLSYCEDGSLVTQDEPPVCLGSITPSAQLPDGKPLRYGVTLALFTAASCALALTGFWQQSQRLPTVVGQIQP